jgi:hypothetical protein
VIAKQRVFALAVALAAGCGAPPSLIPLSSSSLPVDSDELPVSQVAFEPGALPSVPTFVATERPRVEIGPVPADAEVTTTTRVIDGPVLGKDPQVAVGDRFVFVYESHRYELVDKATGKLAPARAGDEIASNGDFGVLFAPLWSTRDKHGRPNAENINGKQVFGPSDAGGCDPARIDASPSCLRDFDDARILWDERRKRFWIEARIADRGGEARGRTLVAIAVSRTADPRDGFHRYALVPEVGHVDRPRMALGNRYLIVGHKSSPEVFVFDADKLAAGNPGRGPVRVAKFDVGEYQLKYFGPVNQHGDAGGVVYLLGSDGSDRVKLLALVNRDPNRATTPDIVPGRWIGISRKIEAIENNPVWRAGLLTATWDECATPSAGPCANGRVVHVLRLPATLDGPGASVEVKRLRAAGYLDFAFGVHDADDGPQDRFDYERPALDVNKNGDVVIVYARRAVESAQEIDPEVRYSILYHGESRPRAGVLVKKGSWFDVPDIVGGEGSEGGFDLAGAAIDPSDDRTVWITHAYADKSVHGYRQVVAAVAP